MKKQGPGFAEFSPGQSVLGCEQLPGSNGASTVWLQDFQGPLLLGSYHAVPPFPRTSWRATLGPAAFPPLEAGNCPLPGRVQLSLLQEASLDGAGSSDQPGLEQPHLVKPGGDLVMVRKEPE